MRLRTSGNNSSERHKLLMHLGGVVKLKHTEDTLRVNTVKMTYSEMVNRNIKLMNLIMVAHTGRYWHSEEGQKQWDS